MNTEQQGIEYLHHNLETRVQRYWEQEQSFAATEDSSKEKFYCLSMFPYPSGQLHMGHVRNYTIGDVIARYQRMLGKNVMQPMGWDAFGLPAENAAIKNNVPPAEWTRKNIAYMKAQLQRLGFAYDWNREIATCDPDYYRWEQWLFTKLFEKGLVYKKTAPVNWCPHDLTVLANEQVIDGCCWRCDTEVERKEIPQWFMRITDYAEELLDDLDQLNDWPEQVRTMQRNWIGRSEGLEVHFGINGYDKPLKVFTTRPDTLMGVSYVAVAPEHPVALAMASRHPKLAAFIADCSKMETAEAAMETMEKKGIDIGLKAIHPITGDAVPIYAANFVLMGYGEGAVMAVPAHDQRDWEFSKKYDLPIKQVIRPTDGSTVDLKQGAYTEKGLLMDSGMFSDLDFDQAFDAISKSLETHKKGKRQINYRLRDWGISRQRYWGTPIPIINCPDCGAVGVPEADLPVRLPEKVELDGVSSPIKKMRSFIDTTCPQCNQPAERETDTFDTFMESSWYFARFCCPDNKKSMLDKRANHWLPVDQYVGGIEHAILHLLYARFFTKLLRDAKISGVDLKKSSEPFTRLLTQGMVLKDGIKMSKSKGNTVDPQTLIEQYGADTVRLFTMFAAPPEQSLEWSDSGVEGSYRFLKRLWNYAHEIKKDHKKKIKLHTVKARVKPVDSDWFKDKKNDWSNASANILDARREIHGLLKQARFDFEKQQFNTVVAACMKIMNCLSKKVTGHDVHAATLHCEGLSILLRLLSPIAPHIAQYLWTQLCYGDDILDASWPVVDESALVKDTIELIVQINGKLRGKIEVATSANKAEIEQQALSDENVLRFLGDATPKKIIVVPGRLVNIVAPA